MSLNPFHFNKRKAPCPKKITGIQIVITSFLFSFFLSKASETRAEEGKNLYQSKITEQRVKKSISPTNSNNVYKIMHAPDLKTLKQIIKQEEKNNFLKQLCKKQKQFSRIPWGCYELYPLDNTYDPFCLKLKLKDLEIDSLKQAISLKTLSGACRKHLNFKLKILIYRKSKKEEIEAYE